MGTEWKLDSQLKASLERMEEIVKRLQHPETGVAITTVKKVLWSAIPNVCTGSDIVNWLMVDLKIAERLEALNVAKTVARYGYIFVANDSKLTVKDDLTYHRFQRSYFWPTKERAISNTDYAIHLCKRLFYKNRSNLETYEMEQFSRLQNHLGHKWEYVWFQAESSYKSDKRKNKDDQHIIESQERAFWNLHKPPPYLDYVLAADPLKFKKDFENLPVKAQPAAAKVSFKRSLLGSCYNEKQQNLDGKNVSERSKSVQSLIMYCTQYSKFDPTIRQRDPATPAWYIDEQTLFSESNHGRPSPVAQVEKWALSFEELLKDPEGVVVFLKHLEREHSSENLRFWMACDEFRACTLKKLCEKAELIYRDYLSPQASYQVNLDSKLMLEVKEGMLNPHHFTFQAAQYDIFRLMRSDSYPRFLKSDNYLMLCKEALSPAHKGQEKKGILTILTSPQHKI